MTSFSPDLSGLKTRHVLKARGHPENAMMQASSNHDHRDGSRTAVELRASRLVRREPVVIEGTEFVKMGDREYDKNSLHRRSSLRA